MWVRLEKSWALKNWFFELWCWRRFLRVPWTARRSSQSILKEISPECSLEGLMLKLKLQSFGHLMWRADSFEKTLMLGKIEGRWRRGQQRMRWLDGITHGHEFGWTPGVGDGQGGLVWCSPWGRKESDMTERLNWNWRGCVTKEHCFYERGASTWVQRKNIFKSTRNYNVYYDKEMHNCSK